MSDSFDDNLVTRYWERHLNFWTELEQLKSDPSHQEPSCVVARSVEDGLALAGWIEEFESENE